MSSAQSETPAAPIAPVGPNLRSRASWYQARTTAHAPGRVRPGGGQGPRRTRAHTHEVLPATLAGTRLARRRPGQRQTWFAAAAGALLIIAGLHVLPDSWAGARDAHIWPGLVPLAAVATFAAAGLAARAVCGCQEHQEQASGTGTAATLAVHAYWKVPPSRWPPRTGRPAAASTRSTG